MTTEEYTCARCGRYPELRENSDPTKFCDECAHFEIDRLNAFVDRLGNALQEQADRWGLYGSDSQKALAEFIQMQAIDPERP
jgi:hypothetical protein